MSDMSHTSTTADHPEVAALRADVAIAARAIAPAWPLTSFVAVNPLRGFEHLPFDEACQVATDWFGARTHLPLAWYRDAFAAGAIGEQDLRLAVVARDPVAACSPPVELGGDTVDVVDLVLHDLVHGPAAADHQSEPPDAWTASVVDYVGTWCAAFVDEGVAAMAMPDRELGLYRAWHRLSRTDPRLRQLVGRSGRRWIGAVPEEPAAALHAALTAIDVDAASRVDVVRGLLARMPGWAGIARWADEWAPTQHAGPRLRIVDLVAMLAVIDAAAGGAGLCTPVPRAERHHADPELLAARVDSVLARWGCADELAARQVVADVLGRIDDRAAVWLAAHEGAFRDGLLGALDRAPAAPDAGQHPPTAQLVACIDVRSEVLRRHLEQLGDYETFGFAGFFGVPVRWRPLGSDAADPRCPVLVTPTYEVGEAAIAGGDAELAGRAAVHAGLASTHAASANLAAPFAWAESAGWVLGPLAALRTTRLGRHRQGRRSRAVTGPVVAAESHPTLGLPLEQRTLFAEAIVRTIGIERFAPVVVLCGHGSRTVNNPHASSLDCGACGGAPGGASARVAAAVLNDPAVRSGLLDRGIEIPAGTWFVAAEHDTASDRVELLDLHTVPDAMMATVRRLEADLLRAGEATAAERSRRLPGDPRRVRERGGDWAQVRPEWGLAGNAAFVAGPRSITRELDLGGRVFLHSYRSDLDPEGVALETILTAPLVVAQWISSQYYFSTVDPEVFGAGDKTLHNPVGGIGVLRGPSGDLAVGLPEQSVMVGDRLEHLPLRLLAVVQAPIDRIEEIVARNLGLRQLLEHGWIHLAARADEREPWSVRSPAGTWTTWFPAVAGIEAESTDLPSGPVTLGAR
jgi:uncharacterized protein YbcC (UPF0753/DUF2309 family)